MRCRTELLAKILLTCVILSGLAVGPARASHSQGRVGTHQLALLSLAPPAEQSSRSVRRTKHRRRSARSLTRRLKARRAVPKNRASSHISRFATGFTGAPLVFEQERSVATATVSTGPAAGPATPQQVVPQPVVRPVGGPGVRSPARRRWEGHEEGVIAFGLVAGGQLRDWFSTSGQTGSSTFDDKSARFMVGPTLQFNLSPRYMLEFDAIRRGFGARTTGNIFGVGFSTDSTGSSWEFPVIFKRRFLMARHVKPLLGAGISLRHVSQDSSLTSLTGGANSTMNSSQGSISVGIPISAGIDFRTGIFHFTPELRYTLWTADKSFTPIRTPGLYDANPNQVAFILGFTIN